MLRFIIVMNIHSNPEEYLLQLNKEIENNMNSLPKYSYDESVNIFDIYNTFLQSPVFCQLSIFFLDRIPQIFLPIEKSILIDGLKSFAYHLIIEQPDEQDKINNLVKGMIVTVQLNFVSNEEFLNYWFIKNIQDKNTEGLINTLDYLKEYQNKFISAIEQEHFLKDPSVKRLLFTIS